MARFADHDQESGDSSKANSLSSVTDIRKLAIGPSSITECVPGRGAEATPNAGVATNPRTLAQDVGSKGSQSLWFVAIVTPECVLSDGNDLQGSIFDPVV